MMGLNGPGASGCRHVVGPHQEVAGKGVPQIVEVKPEDARLFTALAKYRWSMMSGKFKHGSVLFGPMRESMSELVEDRHFRRLAGTCS